MVQIGSGLSICAVVQKPLSEELVGRGDVRVFSPLLLTNTRGF